MKTPFVGDVDASGKLEAYVRGQIAEYIRTFAGLRIEVKIVQHRDKRSTAQNARLWALYTVAAKSLGYDTPEEIHEACAWKLLRLPDDERTGTPRRHRTPKLNTKEFTDYMDATERLLIEYGADLTNWDAETERIVRAA